MAFKLISKTVGSISKEHSKTKELEIERICSSENIGYIISNVLYVLTSLFKISACWEIYCILS